MGATFTVAPLPTHNIARVPRTQSMQHQFAIGATLPTQFSTQHDTQSFDRPRDL
jgi:hypothetical protein